MKLEDKVKVAVLALADKKAKEVVCTEVSELTSLADCFIMATATSSTHVKALADEVEYQLGLQGIEPRQIEGKATGWILLDYYDVVIHVFLQDQREYYNLEKLWADSTPLDISSLLTEE